MRAIITVTRDEQNEEQSLGVCSVHIDGKEVFFSECIERGDLNNQKSISCIPKGKYPVVLEYSPRFKKDLWEIKNVPNRSECKFHAANYARQLNGCIALGTGRLDIDKDGNVDVTSSRVAMNKFHAALKDFKEALLIVR